MKRRWQITTKNSRIDNFTKGFLMSYLLVMILPICFNVVFYFYTYGLMRENANHAVATRLSDAVAISDVQILRYFSQIESLANDKEVASLLKMEALHRGSSEISDVFHAMNHNSQQLRGDLSVFEYYVHFKDIDVTLSSTTAFLDSRLYYGNFFKWADMPSDQWYSFTEGQRHDKRICPVENIYVNSIIGSTRTGKSEKALMFLQSLPLDSHSVNNGYIALFIKENEFTRLLKGIDTGLNGFVCILDKDNNLIASYNPSPDKGVYEIFDRNNLFPGYDGGYIQKLHDQDYSITYTKSKILGWTYVAAIPTAYQYGKLTNLAFRLIIIDIVILLVCLMLAAYLAKRNALPWNKFREAIDYTPGIAVSRHSLAHSIEEISGEVLQAIESSKSLTANQMVLLKMIQTNVIDKVLTGSFANREQMMSDCRMAGLNLASPCYCVCMMRFQNIDGNSLACSDDADALYASVHSFLESWLGINKTFLSTSSIEGAITFLILLEDSAYKHDMIGSCLDKIVSSVSEKYGITVSITVSSLYKDIYDSNDAIMEVRRVFSCVQNSMEPAQVIWANQLPYESTSLRYPIDFEKQLNDQVSVGNSVGVSLMFDKLYQDNLEASKLDPLVTELLRDQLCATVVRLLSRFKYDTQRIKDNINMLGGISLKDIIDCAGLICVSLSDKIREDSKGEALSLSERLIQFVHDNYSNYTLCMDSLRTMFDCSSFYINEIFTTHTGQSFSAYLEKVRLEKACELLSSDLCISEISETVGYSSSHSFRRAFKRCYGIQPIEYRKLIVHA